MPVDFLSDSEAAKYGRYDGPPSRAEMEKIFFLDNEDMALIKGHRGRHIRCGFALQLVTVRYLGCFLADPLEVPNEVLDVAAAQLGIDDPSCVKRYTERDKTRLEHTWEIAKAFGLKDFASAEAELAGKIRAHAWNTGDGSSGTCSPSWPRSTAAAGRCGRWNTFRTVRRSPTACAPCWPTNQASSRT
ncbi:DUF4158 domain-containing protein [Nonomuraea sp. M3C6]|uniref:DUF4158 domain-containing protein n=1 Tax=Nonomuraea marmarensis TaxID=3351344 RepID=A0ABW7ATH4_9ACTN